MSKETEVMEHLRLVMIKAILEMKTLVDNDLTQRADFVYAVNLLLQGLIATAADLAEVYQPGAGAYLYSEIEAGVKSGGLHAIEKIIAQEGSIGYSISNIDPSNMEMGMNYLGQQLATTLFKGIHELPKPLQSEEMLLRGIEALLTNLLHQKFSNPHQTLDHLCEHVHATLVHLKSQEKPAEQEQTETVH